MDVTALPQGEPRSPAPVVDIVVPVHNEQADLARSVRRLERYLRDRFPFPAVITIADNASTDGTWAIARTLERELCGVRAIRLPRRGRGGALATAWLASEAPVVAYMDVDLSTDLDALLPLVAPLVSGHSDVSIGSRLSPGSRVVRGARREVISRSYNLLLHLALHPGRVRRAAGLGLLRPLLAVPPALLLGAGRVWVPPRRRCGLHDADPIGAPLPPVRRRAGLPTRAVRRG